jgi:acyl-CoA synthetase (AMP-forming)/AMP-acid ligase II
VSNHAIDYIEAIADAFPDRPAIVFRSRDGDALRLSYGQLEARLNRTARALLELGIAAGDHVGCHMYDTPAHVDLMLGAWKIGAVPINVNFRYVDEELRYLFDDADLKLVVSEPDLVERARDAAEGIDGLEHVLEAGEAWERRMASSSPRRPDVQRTGDELYVLYTGGTTGMPKGVVWRHEDIMHASFGTQANVPLQVPAAPDPQAVLQHIRETVPSLEALRSRCCLLPLMHAGGQWSLIGALLRGGIIVLITDVGFDPTFALRVMQEEGVNIAVGAGDAHARPVLDAIEREHGGTLELPKLLLWGTGAVMITPHIKDQLAAALPGTIIYDALGASESGGQGTAAGYSEEGSPRFQLDDGHVILDEDMRPIGKDERRVGKLAKSGHIPLAYYKDEKKTAETFPVIDGVRYSIPGDMARWEEDGTVTLFGRGSVSINTGGEKVFPEEVEKALKTHPDVFDAVVVGTPDERFLNKVTAVVQLREGRDNPGLGALAAHCKQNLAGYKAPRALVIQEQIVRSPSGKPDYRWAAEAARQALEAEGTA